MKTILIKIFHLLSLNVRLLRDYLKNLGLACVVGSLTGFFLKSHNHHHLTSLAILFTLGAIFSYFGVRKVNNHD